MRLQSSPVKKKMVKYFITNRFYYRQILLINKTRPKLRPPGKLLPKVILRSSWAFCPYGISSHERFRAECLFGNLISNKVSYSGQIEVSSSILPKGGYTGGGQHNIGSIFYEDNYDTLIILFLQC